MTTYDARQYVPSGHSFALCLSHDVDRVSKSYQGLYRGLRDRDPYHLASVLSDERPYWGFDEVMRLEEQLGVRSSFNFLDEKRLLADKPPTAWVDPRCWIRYNYYDLESPEIRSIVRELDANGWEIGLHGSYDTAEDPRRLAREKSRLEAIVDHPVVGGRQHFLNLSVPKTWRHHREIGLGYDSSVGSGRTIGFQGGYGLRRPFDDEFVVFPLTAMDQAVMDLADDLEVIWEKCERLLEEAVVNGAVMSVDWHQRVFNAREFPGWGEIYRRIVERALELDAWVGPPGELYEYVTTTTETASRVESDAVH